MSTRLPASILLYNVAPFLEDRQTWNALASVNKELYTLSKECSISAPWPQVRFRIAAGRAWAVAFGNGFAACGTEKGRIQIWNKRDGSTKVLRDQHKRRVYSTIVIQDLLISGSEDGSLLVWKNQNWSKADRFSAHMGGVLSMCAWSDEEGSSRVKIRIAIACTDRKIRILKLHEVEGNMECLEDIDFPTIETAHRGPIHSICKIGNFLISGGSDEQLLAWPLVLTDEQGSLGSSSKLPFHRVKLPATGEVRSFSVLNDCLAVACGKTIILYDDNLHQTKILKGHHSNIRSVCFSHDGSLVASACSDGTIRLWSMLEEICLKKWEGHNSFLVCALAIQGTSIVSVGSDGTIAFWRIPPFSN